MPYPALFANRTPSTLIRPAAEMTVFTDIDHPEDSRVGVLCPHVWYYSYDQREVRRGSRVYRLVSLTPPGHYPVEWAVVGIYGTDTPTRSFADSTAFWIFPAERQLDEFANVIYSIVRLVMDKSDG